MPGSAIHPARRAGAARALTYGALCCRTAAPRPIVSSAWSAFFPEREAGADLTQLAGALVHFRVDPHAPQRRDRGRQAADTSADDQNHSETVSRLTRPFA